MTARAWGESRRGSGRQENQDALGIDLEQGLFVVSDGMGGHAQGGMAAKTVVSEVLRRSPPEEPEPRRKPTLKSLVGRAHRQVRRLAAAEGHQGDMGATVVCLRLLPAGYQTASVGDSRIYLWRDGKLTQLTQDQTLVQRYVSQGVISSEEAEFHPQRHVLLQAVGVGRLLPEVTSGPLKPGDRFLLSSDGVHQVVASSEIGEALGRDEPQEAGRELLDLVSQRDGNDDATAVLVYV